VAGFTFYNSLSGDHSTIINVYGSHTGLWAGEEDLLQTFNAGYTNPAHRMLTTPAEYRYWQLESGDSSSNYWRIYELRASRVSVLNIDGLDAGMRVKFYDGSDVLIDDRSVISDGRRAICRVSGTTRIEIFEPDGITMIGSYSEAFAENDTWVLRT
jgi:hypothetical protein